MIEARFDAVSGADAATDELTPPEPSPKKRTATNGVSDHDGTDLSASPEPVKKRAKRSELPVDADAKLAAQLQAQENQLARGRKTRGGNDRKAKKPKAPRKKSAKKVRAEDDSDVDASDASGPPKRKAGGGFQKPFNLSETLSVLVGETQVGNSYTCPASLPSLSFLRPLTDLAALPASGGQEAVGAHQSERFAGSQ